MISVQNHRQLSSGSKIGGLVFLATLVLVSCSALLHSDKSEQKLSENKTENTSVQKKDTTKEKSISLLDRLFNLRSDTLLVRDTFYVKDSHKVGLILPFQLDSLRLDKPEEEIYPPSMLALQFYEGVQIALDSLEEEGVNIDLHVYDYHKSSGRLKELLKDTTLKEMDYIVGPLYPFYLKYVTAFGKKHDIPVISPLSSDTSVASHNYFAMFTPSAKVHARQIAQYITQQHPHASYLVLHTDSSELSNEEKSFNRFFKQSFNQAKDTAGVVLDLEEFAHAQPTDSILAPHFLPQDTNIVYVPSLDQSYVYYVFSQLQRLQQDSNYVIKVVGPPHWSEYESIDLEYFNNLNVHITSNYWIEFNNERTEAFREVYRQNFYTDPSRFVYQGYDIFAFVGKICLNYGEHHEFAFQQLSDQGLSMDFKVKPIIQNDSVIRYENHKTRLLQFKDHNIQRIDRNVK